MLFYRFVISNSFAWPSIPSVVGMLEALWSKSNLNKRQWSPSATLPLSDFVWMVSMRGQPLLERNLQHLNHHWITECIEFSTALGSHSHPTQNLKVRHCNHGIQGTRKHWHWNPTPTPVLGGLLSYPASEKKTRRHHLLQSSMWFQNIATMWYVCQGRPIPTKWWIIYV